MKQLIVIAVALASVNAFASRARMTALGNSPHLIDTQTVYSNPSDIFRVGGDYVNLESGVTGNATAGATTQNANAEGMITRSHGDAKWGLSLGHQSDNASTWGLRPAAFINQQNPLEVTYGTKVSDFNVAGTLVYSNYNNKLTGAAVEKESSAGVRLGFNNASWDGALRLGLINKVENTGDVDFTGTLGLGADLGYSMDNLYIAGGITSSGYKVEAAGVETAKVTSNSYNVGVTASNKKDGSELFYGIGLTMSDSKNATTDTKSSSMNLPVWIGLEVDAASWLTVRGSVSQSTLINQSKTETGATTTTDLAPGANTTTVAGGVGLKFNKVNIDGTLSAMTSSSASVQTVNTTNLLAQLGLSYWY